MKRILLLLICVFCTVGCRHEYKAKDLDQIKWMLGNWESQNDNQTLKLTWNEENDSTYKGIEQVPIVGRGTLILHYVLGIHPGSKELYYTIQRNSNPADSGLAGTTLNLSARIKSHDLFIYNHSKTQESMAYVLKPDSSFVKKNYGLINMTKSPITETVFHKVK